MYLKYLIKMFMPAFKLSMAEGGGGVGGNDYLSSIPEEYREVPSIRDAGSMDALLKQHVNLETKMGNSLSFPGEDADDEQMSAFYTKIQERAGGLTRIPSGDDEKEWADFYSKSGMPKESGDYTMPEIKYGEDGKFLDQGKYGEEFRAHAHKMGLSAKQFTGIMSYFGNQTVNNMETRTQEHDAAMTALRNEWGDATDARVARVQKLVADNGGDEAIAGFGDIGNNPAVLMMLDKLATATMEEGSLGKQGGSGDAATRSGIEDEIATLKGNSAYMDRKNPDHDRTVSRVNSLFERLEKYKEAA